MLSESSFWEQMKGFTGRYPSSDWLGRIEWKYYKDKEANWNSNWWRYWDSNGITYLQMEGDSVHGVILRVLYTPREHASKGVGT